MTPHTALELVELAEGNKVIQDSIGMTYAMLQNHAHPLCSVSGGSDSDIVLDMCVRLDKEKKISYVWFNTGLEYKATKKHLDMLEARYGVVIERVLAHKSIPVACKEYGVPFLTKFVSKMIEYAQNRGFDWSDMPYEEMLQRYPRSKTLVDWWHNRSTFQARNIKHFSYLREFLMSNPPSFRISAQCCDYAKKKPAVDYAKANDCDLQIIGIRKAEGGIRSNLKSCYTETVKPRKFFPIFWYHKQDKLDYERLFNIQHSECYTVWGLKRTGCAGCPFNHRYEDALSALDIYEPGLARAARNIFAESYAYTQKYREFVLKHRSDATLNLFAEN